MRRRGGRTRRPSSGRAPSPASAPSAPSLRGRRCEDAYSYSSVCVEPLRLRAFREPSPRFGVELLAPKGASGALFRARGRAREGPVLIRFARVCSNVLLPHPEPNLREGRPRGHATPHGGGASGSAAAFGASIATRAPVAKPSPSPHRSPLLPLSNSEDAGHDAPRPHRSETPSSIELDV
jgi:hypothetical protein